MLRARQVPIVRGSPTGRVNTASNFDLFHSFNFKLRSRVCPYKRAYRTGLPYVSSLGCAGHLSSEASISMLIPTLTKPTLACGVLLLVLGVLPTAVHSLTSYANDFVDPDYIVRKQFPTNTVIAQKTIVQWANQYATLGPWSMCSALSIEPGNSIQY